MPAAWLKIGRERSVLGASVGFMVLLAAHVALAATSTPAPRATPGPTQKPPSSTFNREWVELVTAAKREGKLIVSTGSAGQQGLGRALIHFEQKFGIKPIVGRGSGSQQIDRILAERRGGRYNVDIVISGQRGILGTLYPAGALESIKDLMFHPEVVDKSLWRNGIHRWGDPQGRYVFIHAARSSPIGIAINTKLVQRGEIKSFWDLLKPKWKGKIVSIHPRVGGVSYNLIYEHKDLGPEYLRRIYSERVLSYVATAREYADGLAVGGYAVGFLLGSVQRELNLMIEERMPVAMLSAEDVGLDVAHGTIGGTGLIAAVTRAANPNAQKLFVNWYLAREGQQLLNKGGIKETGGEYQSLRADVPNDDILPQFRLPENFQLPEAEPDFVQREAKASGYVIELADKLGL